MSSRQEIYHSSIPVNRWLNLVGDIVLLSILCYHIYRLCSPVKQLTDKSTHHKQQKQGKDSNSNSNSKQKEKSKEKGSSESKNRCMKQELSDGDPNTDDSNKNNENMTHKALSLHVYTNESTSTDNDAKHSDTNGNDTGNENENNNININLNQNINAFTTNNNKSKNENENENNMNENDTIGINVDNMDDFITHAARHDHKTAQLVPSVSASVVIVHTQSLSNKNKNKNENNCKDNNSSMTNVGSKIDENQETDHDDTDNDITNYNTNDTGSDKNIDMEQEEDININSNINRNNINTFTAAAEMTATLGRRDSTTGGGKLALPTESPLTIPHSPASIDSETDGGELGSVPITPKLGSQYVSKSEISSLANDTVHKIEDTVSQVQSSENSRNINNINGSIIINDGNNNINNTHKNKRRKLQRNESKHLDIDGNSNRKRKRKTYWQSMISKRKTMLPTIITHILTLIVVFSYFVNIFSGVINFWGIMGMMVNGDHFKQEWICSVSQSITVILLHTAKVTIYGIFILRVKTSFKGSVYEYPSLLINGLFFGLFGVYMVDIFGDIFETNGYWIYDNNYDIYWCQLKAAPWGLGFTVLADVFFSVVCLVLFTKPIKQLMKQVNSEKLQTLNTKYSMLTVMAVSSTCMYFFLVP